MYKVGDTFLCIEDFKMKNGKIDYSKGKFYKSEIEGSITDNEGFKDHVMGNKSFQKHFITISQLRDNKLKSILDKTNI